MGLTKFKDFLVPGDLGKIYLMAHSDRFSFSHIDYLVRRVAERLFDLVLPPGIFPESVDRARPLYSYGNSAELAPLLASGAVLRENVYNQPENLKYANNKIRFHQMMAGLDYVPKTVFSAEDAEGLKFPVIAKPRGGSKGEGVTVFKTVGDLRAHDGGPRLDVFCEKFDLVREFRVLTVRGRLTYAAERVPTNDKARSLREGEDVFDRASTRDSRSGYEWVEGTGELDKKQTDAINKILPEACERLKLDVLGLDFGVDRSGKVWLIEANTCPGLNNDQVVCLYLHIFEDFYGRTPDAPSMARIEELRAELRRAGAGEHFSQSAHMGRRMDWTYGEDGRKTSTVKFDIERSFGETLKNKRSKINIK